jgi:hypothetical protein
MGSKIGLSNTIKIRFIYNGECSIELAIIGCRERFVDVVGAIVSSLSAVTDSYRR